MMERALHIIAQVSKNTDAEQGSGENPDHELLEQHQVNKAVIGCLSSCANTVKTKPPKSYL